MKLSGDYRAIGRMALSGRWGLAIAVSFVAGLLNGSAGSSYNSAVNSPGGQNLVDMSHITGPVVTFGIVLFLALFIIGGAIDLGHNLFYIRLLTNNEVRFGILFERFEIIWRALGLRLFTGLFTFLWSLLFIIPGIVAAYSYSMSFYLMAEYPGTGIVDAVDRSKLLMRGNRMRLFFLDLSFIGWGFLCILTFGIGFLWLTPYIHASRTAFYLDISRQAEQFQNSQEF